MRSAEHERWLLEVQVFAPARSRHESAMDRWVRAFAPLAAAVGRAGEAIVRAFEQVGKEVGRGVD